MKTTNLKLAEPPQPRSPEREALAQAIELAASATLRLARLKAAYEGAESSLYGADGAISSFDRAELALKKAKESEGKHLAAVAAGEASGENPVQEAERALVEADARCGQGRKTRDGLKAEIESTDTEIVALWDRRDDAVRSVLRSEATAYIATLMQEALALRDQLGAKRAVLMLLKGAVFDKDREAAQPIVNYLASPAFPEEWNYRTQKHPALAPWWAALESLSVDADAPLPV